MAVPSAHICLLKFCNVCKCNSNKILTIQTTALQMFTVSNPKNKLTFYLQLKIHAGPL